MTDLARRLSERCIVDSSGCLHWTGYVMACGYGRIRVNGQLLLVHRTAYELFVGPIPDGMEIDHQCHNRDETCVGGFGCPHRRCINPDHLEPASHEDNVRRGFAGRVNGSRQRTKSQCPQGHLYDEANTITYGNGYRKCRTCRAERERLRKRRLRARRAADRGAKSGGYLVTGHPSAADKGARP